MDKIKYLCYNEETTNLVLQNNQDIKKCKRYNYLGIRFNKQGIDDTDLSRINKTRRIIKSVKGIL